MAQKNDPKKPEAKKTMTEPKGAAPTGGMPPKNPGGNPQQKPAPQKPPMGKPPAR